MALVADLTEIKQLEEEKRRKEELCRLMLQGIPSPAWLVSRERRILAQNKAAASLFGSKVGDYCWERVLGGGNLPDEYREVFEKNGSPLPGTNAISAAETKPWTEMNDKQRSEWQATIWIHGVSRCERCLPSLGKDVTNTRERKRNSAVNLLLIALQTAIILRFFMQKLEKNRARKRKRK
jgi:PAS domain-containing protein